MKIIKYSVASTLLLSLAVGGHIIDVKAESKTYNSTGHLKLSSSSLPVHPVDPINPEIPVDPIDPAQPGTSGPLSIDFASNLDFGEQEISTNDERYKAKPTKVKNASGDVLERPNYVQVTDNRGGQKGWTLSVTQLGQFKTVADAESAGGVPLNGAVITFKNGEVVSSINAEAKKPSKVHNTIELDPETNAAIPVMAAAVGEGGGTWIERFGDETTLAESVELFVPAGTIKEAKSYHTSLQWTLSDSPQNGN